MSMYNLIHGVNPLSNALLSLLDLDRARVGRFRDTFLEKAEDGSLMIAIYTRNGGGNRSDYRHVFDELRAHPLYLHDADDDFDRTYATIWFKAPEEARGMLERIVRLGEEKAPAEKWRDFFATFNGPNAADDPRVKRVTEALRPVFDAINESINKG